MRPLPVPPNPYDQKIIEKLLPLLANAELAEFISKANAEYYYWDELRYKQLPVGLTAAEAWGGVKFSRGIRKPLPLRDPQGNSFSYWVPDHLVRLLHEVDRQGGGVLAAEGNSSSIFEEMKDRILIESLMEEAIATSQIEGAVTTRHVAKELLRSGRTPKDRSEQMIVNGYRTIQMLRSRLDRPLSMELLHEIQESMTRETLDHPADAGRLRTDLDKVCIVDGRDNEVIFTPPPAENLPARMKQLINFANQPPASEPFIHPIIRASILHFWLAYEHPYVDGNGRTARALFYWVMMKNGYWLFEFLTISRIIHAAPMQYYRAFLYSEQDENDLTYFLVYLLDVTQKALGALHDRLRAMRQEQLRMQAIRITAKLNPRQRALVDHALRHPNQVYTFESHQNSNGIAYQSARTDLMELAAKGLMVEIGSRRQRQFIPAPDLNRKLGIRH
jgi:Fic family protein